MENFEIEKRILNIVDDAEIEVVGADCDFNVTVISNQFSGLLPVKRQQMILEGFKDVLASGTLHALTIKPFTFSEWNKKYSSLVKIDA